MRRVFVAASNCRARSIRSSESEDRVDSSVRPRAAPQTLDVAPPMGIKVLASLENPYGDYCVDVFVREDSTFGFEEYRGDPEDVGSWHSLHRYSSLVFKSEEDALAQAKACVAWLKTDGT